jgi:hypothetical protein
MAASDLLTLSQYINTKKKDKRTDIPVACLFIFQIIFIRDVHEVHPFTQTLNQKPLPLRNIG